MDRRIRFEGIDNFRDFGGYARAGGGRLATRRLYRSGSHGRATEADLNRLAALKVAVIIDLRRPDERRRDPARRPAGFGGSVIASDEEAPDDWRNHILNSDLSSESFHQYLLAYYRRAPFENRHVDLFRRYFRALAHGSGPILIHCAAGKDRTGLLAALTHHLTGVHPDDIMEDYLLTNDERRLETRAPMVAATIEELTGRRPAEEALMTAMGVDAEYLEAAFAAIEARCGSLDAYLQDLLAIDPSARARIGEGLDD